MMTLLHAVHWPRCVQGQQMHLRLDRKTGKLKLKPDLHSHHAEQQMKQYYTPELIKLVQEKYSADFELFGYSKDLDISNDGPDAGEQSVPSVVIPRLTPTNAM